MALPLDDVRWSKLHDVYGAATDVPPLLAVLHEARGARRDEVMEDLWSRLCHQGTVPNASYAAVPHLVAEAERQRGRGALELLGLVGAIARSRDAEPLPSDLADAFERAVARADALVLAHLDQVAKESDALWALVALAGLRRWYEEAWAIEGVADGELALSCRSCDAAVAIHTVGSPPFPVDGGRAERVGAPRHFGALAELVGRRQPELARRVRGLDVTVRCDCGGVCRYG